LDSRTVSGTFDEGLIFFLIFFFFLITDESTDFSIKDSDETIEFLRDCSTFGSFGSSVSNFSTLIFGLGEES
jgi:hypothetical protein